MLKNIEQDFGNNFSEEFEYRISKGNILQIDTSEISEAVLIVLQSASNGTVTLNNKTIFYTPQKDFVGQDFIYLLNEESEQKVIYKLKIDVVSTFKPKAHILVLLGEELIKSPVMAIYELIKNSYDADAQNVDVVFENIEDSNKARILITDSGTGITKEILENVWFEPGSDFRKPINSNGEREIKRSPIYWRIPMGEKGVGRFAVHKLGNTIKLISRPAEVKVEENGKAVSINLLNYEVSVEIDWRVFSQSKYLDDVKIKWQINSQPETFHFKGKHGTKILIESLKEPWSRGMARQLKRQTISMLSPKNDQSKFKINLDFNNWWLNDFPNTYEILQEAPYKLVAFVDKEYNLTFEYSFSLKNNVEIGKRNIDSRSSSPLDVKQYYRNIKGDLIPKIKDSLNKKEVDNEEIDNYIKKHISSTLPFDGLMLELYSFDLDSQSLRDTTNKPSLIKELLRDHAGIKVFKGDLRVYDYGDPGNDWLGLDLKRVQNKEWFSNNQNIGYVYLDAETSSCLIEKTNREGFIENESYEKFVFLLEFILNEFKATRLSDRNRWLRFNRREKDSFESHVANFKEIIDRASFNKKEDKQKLLSEAIRLESKYESDKNALLLPAGVGMTASFAIHEIEKLIPRMIETIQSTPLKQEIITAQVYELKDYAEGILSILQKGGVKKISLLESIEQAVNNYSLKLRLRNIEVIINHDHTIESIMCEKRLLVMILMNIIDNSIYWLDTLYKTRKGIYISTQKINNGVSVLLVDNGPGFKDSKQDIVQPFFSRKEGGIGIGMYLVDTIMMKFGKLDIIYDTEELSKKNIPSEFTGAAVELIFNKF